MGLLIILMTLPSKVISPVLCATMFCDNCSNRMALDRRRWIYDKGFVDNPQDPRKAY
uniref:Uncharacterized protein n=1 Tax=Acrobeloides nanus TaxID=290746 RepID=A0A914CLP0_9BILA